MTGTHAIHTLKRPTISHQGIKIKMTWTPAWTLPSIAFAILSANWNRWLDIRLPIRYCWVFRSILVREFFQILKILLHPFRCWPNINNIWSELSQYRCPVILKPQHPTMNHHLRMQPHVCCRYLHSLQLLVTLQEVLQLYRVKTKLVSTYLKFQPDQPD